MQRLENGKPGSQPDGEGRKDDVKRDRKRELKPGKEKAAASIWESLALLPEVILIAPGGKASPHHLYGEAVDHHPAPTP